jgi:hypothetical protein
MIKRSTWIWLVLLAAAIAAYFILKNRPAKSAEATPTSAPSAYLITSADGTLQSLRIVDAKGNSVRMQRDPNKVWVLTEPGTGEADQGLAGAAESQVSALRIAGVLTAPADLNTFSLRTPSYTIELVFDSGVKHTIEVGGETPTGSGYYVRFDSSKFYVVSQSGLDALANLLKVPPFPPTATPAATDTETATPTPDTSSTPVETPAETSTPTP